MMLGARAVARTATNNEWPVPITSADTLILTKSTSIPVTMPAGIEAGDLLLIIGSFAGNDPTASGWTRICRFQNYATLAAFYKVAASSSESCTISSNYTTSGTLITYRITGANIAEATSGVSYNPNPNMPAHTPSIANKKYLYFVAVSAGGGVSAGTSPTNYTASHRVGDGAGNGQSIRAAYRNYLEGAEDPGVYQVAESYNAYCTICVFNSGS